MKTVVEYLRKLALTGEDIIDDEKIKKLIEYLVDYYNLSSYVDSIKTQYFPIKPGTKILYNIHKKRVEYFMWPIISESDKISQVPLDPTDRIFYTSLYVLIHIRYEIEHILEIYLKSNTCDSFENNLLHLLLRVYKLYLKNNITEKESNELYIMEKVYVKNMAICPLVRLANYEAYNGVLKYLNDEEPVKEVIERDYKNIMDDAYKKTPSPTMDYIRIMRSHGLIGSADEEQIGHLSTFEENPYKYGLILPK